MKNKLQFWSYLKHRFGVMIVIGEFTLLMSFFLENRSILETATGTSLFFWLGSVLLLPTPLIGGLSLRESLKFFAFFFPLFFLFGLIALVIPMQLVVRVISILAIIWVVVLAFFIKRKPEVFDLKPRINPLIFLETIIIFGLSFLCSHITLSSKLIDTVVASLSPYANYLVLSLVFYFVFSVITIGLHFFKKR
jgi:hypothetical protein